jgi:hypothetical protein
MFLIDKSSNNILRLNEKTFSELGYREREHLQEWIAKNPECFGEPLLIIQKEFDGFADTSERLDLLALDKQGSLVLIENKLDDSGRDVTWQSLKYASYCSSLGRSAILEIYQSYLNRYEAGAIAEQKLTDFFDGVDVTEIAFNQPLTQRIILVAARFRKEVTSTVLWLMGFKIRVQCFKTSVFTLEDQSFLNFEQIIPTKDAEDYMIGMAEKVSKEAEERKEVQHRHVVRMKFWKLLLEAMNRKSPLFQSISPGKNNWLSKGSGISRVAYNFVFTQTYARVELYIDKEEAAFNTALFDGLITQREVIEAEIGRALVWERADENRFCRIKNEKSVAGYDEANWPEMIDFLTTQMIKLEAVMKPRLEQIARSIPAIGL